MDGTWRSAADAVGQTNVGRFGSEHGIADLDELLAPLDRRPGVVLGRGRRVPRHPVRDALRRRCSTTSDGIPWATWFTGGTHNLADACVDRWADATPDAEAIVWEGEDGEVRALDLRGAAAPGRRPGPRCSPSGASARATRSASSCRCSPRRSPPCMAVAKLGAVFLPIFSGYGAEAIAVRLDDAGRQGAGHRRRLPAAGPAGADARHRHSRPSAGSTPSTRSSSCAGSGAAASTRTTTRRRLRGPDGRRAPSRSPPCRRQRAPAVHRLHVGHDRPAQGRRRTCTAGCWSRWPRRSPSSSTCGPGDRLFWFADFGWIMGPWEIIGGAGQRRDRAACSRARPTSPGPTGCGRSSSATRSPILGISPTLIRALMAHGDEPVRRHDLSSLRDPRLDRRAVERGPVALVLRASSAAAAAR